MNVCVRLLVVVCCGLLLSVCVLLWWWVNTCVCVCALLDYEAVEFSCINILHNLQYVLE